jgi:predicted CopG family antitoxin
MREITVTDDQYEQLEKASARTGKSISELVEAAIDKECGTEHRERLRQAFRESAGAAGPEDFDGLSSEEYVETIRRGWGERAGALGASSR